MVSNPCKTYVYEYDRFKTPQFRTSVKSKLGTISGTVTTRQQHKGSTLYISYRNQKGFFYQLNFT